MIQNIILDIDGTLWNTTDVVARAWNHAIRLDGHSAVTVDGARLRQLFGRPMDVIGKMLFTDVTDSVREKLLQDCCIEEQKILEEGSFELLYPHVRETMMILSEQKKISLYIVSNCQSGYIELFLKKNHLEHLVKDMECFGNTGLVKGENIHLLMERNNLLPEETVYVGDTQGDYEAACQVGIPFVYAAYGFGKADGCSYEISDFMELLSLI